jgi:hypothetical protein
MKLFPTEFVVLSSYAPTMLDAQVNGITIKIHDLGAGPFLSIYGNNLDHNLEMKDQTNEHAILIESQEELDQLYKILSQVLNQIKNENTYSKTN